MLSLQRWWPTAWYIYFKILTILNKNTTVVSQPPVIEAPVWFSVEYHFESSGGKNDSYISVFFLFKPLFLHAPLFSCTVNAITTSLLQLLVAMCCVGANGSTCSKLWNKFPGVSYVFSSSCSPLKGRLWSDRLASLDMCRLASGRQEAERKLQHTLQTDRWDTEQKILLLVFYLSTQTYFIFLPRHQGCSFIPLDVTKSHNSLSSAVKKKKKKKAAGSRSPNQTREDLHACDPQRHPGCLPDIRAMPKQQELQSPTESPLAKVNGAMIKWRVFNLEGKWLKWISERFVNVSRPVVNKDLSLQESVESALVAAAQQQPSVVTRGVHLSQSLTVTAVVGSPPQRSEEEEEEGELLVCLHRALLSLQVEADRKHLTWVSWLAMQEADDDTRRQELLCTCRATCLPCKPLYSRPLVIENTV